MEEGDDDRGARAVPDFISYLPARVWYLSHSGRDMWCRRPYVFFFSSSDAATAFATAMQTSFELVPVGLDSTQLVSSDAVEAMRAQEITRVFIDPSVDPSTGDVYGTILRFPALN
jgi:hypothetical protein